MSVESDPVPPVPRHTAPVDEKSIQKLFTVNWQQWFEQVREKINVINESLINLISVSGTGIVVKNGAAWAVRTITGTAAQVDVTNGDGASGDPTVSLAVEVLNSLSLADSSIQPGDNITELTNNAGYIVDAPSDGVLRGRLNGAWAAVPAPGTGTVTSVGMSVPTGLSVSGSPVTSSGTLAVTYDVGYQGFTSAESSKLAGIESGAQVNVGTNLGVAPAASNVVITSSTGGGAILPSAATLTAGVMAAADKQKLDGIASGATAYSDADARAAVIASSIVDGDTTHSPSGDAVFDALALKSNDADVVHKTGNETVAGEKTFTNKITLATGSSTGTVALSSDVGQIAEISFQSNLVPRWSIRGTNAPESGGNTGTNLRLQAKADDGSNLHNVFEVNRATGVLNFSGPVPTVGGEAIAAITQTISNGDTTHAPSGDTVFDALALKADASKFADGVYVPSVLASTNATTTSPSGSLYSRSGNMVTVAFVVQVTPAGAGTTTVTLSLPIASNIGSTADASGMAGNAFGPVGDVYGSASPDGFNVRFTATSTTAQTLRGMLLYRII